MALLLAGCGGGGHHLTPAEQAQIDQAVGQVGQDADQQACQAFAGLVPAVQSSVSTILATSDLYAHDRSALDPVRQQVQTLVGQANSIELRAALQVFADDLSKAARGGDLIQLDYSKRNVQAFCDRLTTPST